MPKTDKEYITTSGCPHIPPTAPKPTTDTTSNSTSIRTCAGGAAAAGFVSPAPVLAAGAAALFIPQVFAKIATNPAYINRLIALTGKKSQGVEATSVAAQLLVADVFYSMADEEKNEMMRYLSEVAKQGME